MMEEIALRSPKARMLQAKEVVLVSSGCFSLSSEADLNWDDKSTDIVLPEMFVPQKLQCPTPPPTEALTTEAVMAHEERLRKEEALSKEEARKEAKKAREEAEEARKEAGALEEALDSNPFAKPTCPALHVTHAGHILSQTINP